VYTAAASRQRAQVAPHVPTGVHGLIKVVENWTFSLFFCFAELWGSVVIAVLFWTLANDVCTVDEAKTVYPMMGISANVALVAAGNYMKLVTGSVLKGASTQVFLQTMVTTIVATSVAMAAVRRRARLKVPVHVPVTYICSVAHIADCICPACRAGCHRPS
jgi:ATP/ADP translocase